MKVVWVATTNLVIQSSILIAMTDNITIGLINLVFKYPIVKEILSISLIILYCHMRHLMHVRLPKLSKN